MIGRIARLFRPYRAQVALVTAGILVTAAVGVANPILIKFVFDRALFPHGAGGPKLGLLYELVGLMVGFAAVGAAIGVWQTYLTSVVGQRVMQDLRDELYAHLQRMS